MGSHLIEIAEAVKGDLDAGSFSLAFEPERKAYVKTDLRELPEGTLYVWVVPFAERKEIGTRGTREVEYDVLVGVVQRLATETNAAIDPLTLLVQEIDDYFDARSLGGREEEWIASEMQAYSQKHLDEQKVFFGTVKLTFTGTRE